MRRAGLTVAIALVITLLAPGPGTGWSATRADPRTAAAGSAGGQHRMVKAIVILKSEADVTAARAARREDRAGAVARILRTHADHAQRELRDLLHRRLRQGLVADVEPLWILNAIAVSAAPSVIRELAARPEVREIRPDLVVQVPQSTGAMAAASPTESNVGLVNAEALWNLGYRGQDVVVANMDTGVDVSHPDLSSRWRGGTNSWYDPNGQHPTTPTDVNGHGTWTMGVMVGGSGGGSAVGVAPDAKWIAVKIFNDQGAASSTRIHQGFQWLLDPDGNPSTADAPDVVNNSWTMSTAGCVLDFQPDLRGLRSAGILPVFAAGNYGPIAGSSRSPANNPEAFAVGATDDSDVVDADSGRGPSACSQPVYPQLVAPGVGVRTTDLYGLYADESGTSMAAPHVAGGLAILLQAYPDLPAERQAAALEAGGVDLGLAGADNSYGHGRSDILAAYEWLGSSPDFIVTASPTSASTEPGGTASYTVSVAPVNGFGSDVSLSLSGLSPAQASWSLTPAVIPAGSGSAQLVVNTAASLPAGTYPLTITATAGAMVRAAAATLVVSAPADFGLTASPATRTVVAGSGGAYSIGVTSLNGFTGDVSLSLAGLPSDVGTATFNPSVVAGAGSSQLTVATLATSPGGTFPLTITGTAGGLARTTSVNLVVTPRDFALSVAPSAVTISRRQSAAYTITVSAMGGSVGNVTLTVGGLPGGTSATIVPNPVGSPGSSTLTVKTTSWTPRGTFTLQVTGMAGALVHQTVGWLTVR